MIIETMLSQFMVRCVPVAEEIENFHWYHHEAALLACV
jgi:hypothetical protein